MTNVIVKTCLNQKIIKKSNLIQAMKNSVCPKAEVIRRRKLSEGRIFPKAEFVRRICPNIFRMFRSVNWTHDMIIVKWSDTFSIFPQAEFVRILSEYLPNVPKCGVNTRHDNREVTLIHFTQAQTLRSDKCATGSIHETGQCLSTLFHADCFRGVGTLMRLRGPPPTRCHHGWRRAEKIFEMWRL